MTQLYSNLVTYMENTTYLFLVLVVLWSPRVSRVKLASLHTASFCLFLSLSLSLASISLILIPEDKEGPTHGHETKDLALLDQKQAFPVLPSLVKIRVGSGNI